MLNEETQKIKQGKEEISKRINGRKRRYIMDYCKKCNTLLEIRKDYYPKHTKLCISCSSKRNGKKSRDKLKTHGDSYTRLYNIWSNMKHRCNYKKHKSYKYYGGKGIEVCKKWKNNFEEFKKWVLNNGYKENLTIDRINNDKNYCPNNCQWLTESENTSKRFKEDKING